MRRRLLGLVVLTGALIATVVPAGAGTYSYSFGTVQASVISGKLPKGGSVVAYLVKLGLEPAGGVTHQAGAVNGGGVVQVLPAPVDQEPPTIKSKFAGCIHVRTSTGSDYGCDLLPPATLDFDALMAKGFVTFAVESEVAQGRRIVANLQLKGNGAAPGVPGEDCKDHQGKACTRNNPGHRLACPVASQCSEPPYKLSSGQTTPVWFYGLNFQAQDVVARDMAAIGSVRSEHVGGGALQSTSVNKLFFGVSGTLTYDVECLVRLGVCRT